MNCFKSKYFKVLIILVISGFMVSLYAVSPSYASKDAHASEETHGGGGHGDAHGGEEHGGGHGEEHGGGHGDEHGGGHHAPAPPLYYLIWLVTIVIGVFTVIGWSAVRKSQHHADEHGHGHHPPEFKGKLKFIGTFLIASVFFLFFAEGFLHWHEPNFYGVLRFVIKTVMGVSLMFWGIAFMHHEEEEDDGHGGGHGH